jgi:hypothetical protein
MIKLLLLSILDIIFYFLHIQPSLIRVYSNNRKLLFFLKSIFFKVRLTDLVIEYYYIVH